MLPQGTDNHFIFFIQNRKNILFLFREMRLYFVLKKPFCVIVQSFNSNIFTESFSQLPTKKKPEMMLAAQGLQGYVAFYRFGFFHNIFLFSPSQIVKAVIFSFKNYLQRFPRAWHCRPC